MKVYISGKIGSEVITPEIRDKFARAEKMLKAKGFGVFNPVNEKWQKTLRREYEIDKYVKSPWLSGEFPDFYTYCLLRDLMIRAQADAVYFLDDWDSSNGAGTEHSFAIACGIKMFWQSEADARIYWDHNPGATSWKDACLSL